MDTEKARKSIFRERRFINHKDRKGFTKGTKFYGKICVPCALFVAFVFKIMPRFATGFEN
jgi:hypothetical protein